jgi:hypothetical protein
MKRSRKPITISLHGATGTGATKAAAIAHAADRIATAFFDETSSYAVTMIRFPNHSVGIIFRTLEGWAYNQLWGDQDHKTLYAIGVYATPRDAERMLRRNVAQDLIWDTPDQGRTVLLPDDERGLADHEYYLTFQQAYRRFAAEGKSDGDCHRLACEAMWVA